MQQYISTLYIFQWASYVVYLPSVMNQSQGMIFIETKNFQAREWLWVCMWGRAHNSLFFFQPIKH